MITVFTPAYNRANLLPRLYNSLLQQSYQNFEWLIVDDGSTDNTEQVVADFIKKSAHSFAICYYKIANGGKHRAINYGVEKAKGECFFIVDSDDWLPSNSLEIINNYFDTIKDNDEFAGVAGLKQSDSPNSKERTFEGEYLDATSLERKKYGIIGEKAEVFKTSILKKYPFPQYPEEKFISEAIVWNKIAHDGFKLRWFNACVYYFEYQEDGLSQNLFKRYNANPIGYLTYLKQEMQISRESILKKYMFFGRALDIVKGSTLNESEAKKLLGLNTIQTIFAKCIWSVYKLIKR